jgi:hypothetical protein
MCATATKSATKTETKSKTNTKSNKTSKAKVEANRRNAEKSSGPKSDDGKARSRFNALKRGMTAKKCCSRVMILRSSPGGYDVCKTTCRLAIVSRPW